MQDIADRLNCSKSTVSYHCKNNTRIKTIDRVNKIPWLRNFAKQLTSFKKRKCSKNYFRLKNHN